MPRNALNTHMATQATEQVTEPVSEATALVNEFTVFNPPFIFADPHLGQFDFKQTRMTTKGHIPDLAMDVPVNRSFFAGQRIYCLSSPVTPALNDNTSRAVLPLNLIDALPFQAQNLCRDANAHVLALYEVVRDLIFQQLTWVFGIFFTHQSGEESALSFYLVLSSLC